MYNTYSDSNIENQQNCFVFNFCSPQSYSSHFQQPKMNVHQLACLMSQVRADWLALTVTGRLTDVDKESRSTFFLNLNFLNHFSITTTWFFETSYEAVLTEANVHEYDENAAWSDGNESQAYRKSLALRYWQTNAGDGDGDCSTGAMHALKIHHVQNFRLLFKLFSVFQFLFRYYSTVF